MTKNLFKLLLMALVLMLALSGCDIIQVDQAADDATIVAEYTGGVITKGEAMAEYNNVVAVYEYEGYADVLKDPETVKAIKQDLLQYLVQERIVDAKSKELGVDTIPEDKRQELIVSSAAEFHDMVEQYMMYLRTEDQTDEEARASTLTYIKNYMGMDEETYVNYALAEYKDEMLFNKLTEGVEVTEEDLEAEYNEAVAADQANFSETPASFGSAKTNGDDTYWAPEGYRTVKHILLSTPQDLADKRDELGAELGDVEIAIDDLLNPEEDEDAIEADADLDVELEEDTEDMTGDEGVVESAAVTPEEGGVPGTDEAVSAEPVSAELASDEPAIAEAVIADAPADEADEAEAEAVSADAPLSIEASDGLEVSMVPVEDEEDEDEGPDYSAMTMDELNAIKADLEAQITALDAGIRDALLPKYDEIKAKIDAGESFDSLIEQYGEDPGMKSEPTMTTGYYVSAASDNWDVAFKDGAMALEKVGDVTGPIMGSYGMHIIRYESDVTPGPVDYESAKETLREHALEHKKETVYEQTTQSWYDDAEIKLYSEKI